MKKNILTDNGGRTSHSENLFDSTNSEAVVFSSKTEYLSFRIKNVAKDHNDPANEIEVDPPIVRLLNEAENVVYPVLRGAGARRHTLKPGEYEDFRLEFNCISKEKNAESIELIFRPSFHNYYVFKMTKQCEGMTAMTLLKEEFQDSIIFDFFAFVFFFLVLLALLFLITWVYVKYKEIKGEDVDLKKSAASSWESIRNAMAGAADKIKETKFAPGKQFDLDDMEERSLKTDAEFDPEDVIKPKSKPAKGGDEDDDFAGEISVEFDRDDENYPAHELRDMKGNDAKATTNAYGTI